MQKKFKVPVGERGRSLLSFLRDRDSGALSVKALKRSIESKRCKVNGIVETFSTRPLPEGAVVEIDSPPEEGGGRSCPVVVWEDDSLAAYDKPPGVVSESPHFGKKLVHRLDKETSGLLLVSKDNGVLQQMIELFRRRLIQKRYLAVVEGCVRQPEMTIVSKLALRRSSHGQKWYGSHPLRGKEAVTQWKVLGRGTVASLLLCTPVTGRTHQIRVHLKEAGHPVLGDYHYAKQFQAPCDAKRHLLHAYQIGFSHPKTGKKIQLTAPVPADFLSGLQQLGISPHLISHFL